jgi:hypothetical protein
MSFLGGIFGGGGKETKTTTTSVTSTADQRVAIEGSTGTLISPGAVVAGQAAISAAPYATVTTNLSSTGLKPSEVQTMLDTVFTAQAADRQTIDDLAVSLGSGLTDLGHTLADSLSATRAPEQSTLNALVPLAIVLVIFLMIGGQR